MAVPFIRPRLLLVGDDITLLDSRELLGSQFEVSISPRLSEAMKSLADHRFQLIVIFHPTESWKRLAGFAARQIPAPKILTVTASEEELEWADEVVSSVEGPYELMKTCAEMFGITTRRRSRRYPNKEFKRAVSTT